jgi:hypothetical protein
VKHLIDSGLYNTYAANKGAEAVAELVVKHLKLIAEEMTSPLYQRKKPPQQ